MVPHSFLSLLFVSWSVAVAGPVNGNYYQPGIVGEGPSGGPTPCSSSSQYTVTSTSTSTLSSCPCPSSTSSSTQIFGTPSAAPTTTSTTSVSSSTSSTSTSTTPSSTPTPTPGSCPPKLKNVIFNGGGNQPSQKALRALPGASSWFTFNLHTSPGQIPLMKYASDVPAAVALLNSSQPPEYLMILNEPDFSYDDDQPTLTPQQAADAIVPLLAAASRSNRTKLIAPAIAHWGDGHNWLLKFYAACNCQDRFYAYNFHLYNPSVKTIESRTTDFHNLYHDKPLWLTEAAPANCSMSIEEVSAWFKELFRWGATQPWLERIFWNTGNRIPNDTNVCNTWLTDYDGSPGPLAETFNNLDCT